MADFASRATAGQQQQQPAMDSYNDAAYSDAGGGYGGGAAGGYGGASESQAYGQLVRPPRRRARTKRGVRPSLAGRRGHAAPRR